MFRLAGLLLMAAASLAVTVIFAASRVAGRAAVHQKGQKCPTAQMLALTYREPPEHWPPAPIIEALLV